MTQALNSSTPGIVVGRAKGLDMSVKLLIEGVDRRVDDVDLLQMQTQQKAVMPGHGRAAPRRAPWASP
jgi:hypothetical protein